MKVYNANSLQDLLDQTGMTFPELAREVRMRTGHLITTQTAKRWVGETAPSANILCSLADVFHVPMETFFSEES